VFSGFFKKFGVNNKSWVEMAWLLGWRGVRELKTLWPDNNGERRNVGRSC
jgi:hypothetical protein